MCQLKLTLLVIAFTLTSSRVHAQDPYGAQTNSFFVASEVVFSKKTLKNKTIAGQHPDGRVLIQCAQKAGPTGDQITREFFWVNPRTQAVEKSGLAYVGFMEMTPLRDGRKVLYTKKNKNLLEIWEAHIGPDDTFSDEKAVNLDWAGEIRNPHVFYLSRYGARILLFSSRSEGRKDYDIFYSEFRDTRWTPPAPLANTKINTPANETYPFVDKDGILYFTSDRPYPGSGETAVNEDIWFAQFDFPLWINASVAALPAPFNNAGGNRALVAACRNLGSGLLISEQPGGQSALQSFHTTLEVEAAPVPQFRALLIGINKYQNQPLETPVPNNRRLKKVLEEKYGFQVETMENPSIKDILQKMESLDSLGENEHLLITLFGHARILSANSVEFIGIDTLTGEESYLSPEAFAGALARIQGPRHIFVVMDACYSGLFRDSLSAVGIAPPGKTRHILASTKEYRVPDKTLFFEFFLEKLERGPEFQDGELYENTFKVFIDNRVKKGEPILPTHTPIFSYNKVGEKEGFRFLTLEEQQQCR